MINQERSTSTAHQEVVLRGDGRFTLGDLAEIAAGNYAPAYATARLADYRQSTNEWELTLLWDEEQKLGLNDGGIRVRNLAAIREEIEKPLGYGAQEEQPERGEDECAAYAPDEEWICVRPAGHHGDHADGYGGSAHEWKRDPELEEQLTDQCQQRTWCVLSDGHPGRHERADGKRVLGDNPQA